MAANHSRRVLLALGGSPLDEAGIPSRVHASLSRLGARLKLLMGRRAYQELARQRAAGAITREEFWKKVNALLK